MKSSVLLVSSGSEGQLSEIADLVLWNGQSSSMDFTGESIIEFIEKNSGLIRKKFLSWIYEVQNSNHCGRRILETYEIDAGLSYWWMCSLGQKANITDEHVTEALKLIALEILVESKGYSKIICHGLEWKTVTCISKYCIKRGIEFSTNVEAKNSFWGNPIYVIKNIILALAYLFYVGFRSFFSSARTKPATLGESELLFVDIFTHLDLEKVQRGRFASGYWSSLPDQLEAAGISVKWLHLFYRSPMTPIRSKARRLVAALNTGAKDQSHFLLDDFLNGQSIGRVLLRYFRLIIIYLRLRDFHANFCPKAISMPIGIVLFKRWEASMIGIEAIANCSKISLFEEFFNADARYRKCVFVCENQPWEHALNYAWRRRFNGDLVGIAHSTIRYWDLRYFFDSREFGSANHKKSNFMPDYLAVNGRAASVALLESGFDDRKIVHVEALRFLYLNSCKGVRSLRKSVLICGDFSSSSTLRLLNFVAENTSDEYSVSFKPHPASTLFRYDSISSKIELRSDSLASLLEINDIVVCTALTTAALDACVLGKRVLVLLDPGLLNLSPLRNLPNIHFIRNSEDFKKSLKKILRESLPKRNHDVFNLDPELNLWKRLLDLPHNDSIG
jgi:surface carbohydrate biosynthesis protein (TIGR04326 family)